MPVGDIERFASAIDRFRPLHPKARVSIASAVFPDSVLALEIFKEACIDWGNSVALPWVRASPCRPTRVGELTAFLRNPSLTLEEPCHHDDWAERAKDVARRHSRPRRGLLSLPGASPVDQCASPAVPMMQTASGRRQPIPQPFPGPARKPMLRREHTGVLVTHMTTADANWSTTACLSRVKD